MKITLLCTDSSHPVNSFLLRWAALHENEHDVSLVRLKQDLPGGDILFLISCAELITAAERAAYQVVLVLHASDLPRGRGWSPHIWQILGGAEQITLSLLEADDAVDSGRIWHQLTFPVARHALWNEINEQLFTAEIDLVDFAVSHFKAVLPAPQSPDVEPTYYRKRTPNDSEIDPHGSIASQFDKIRVCDPARFPAYFYIRGHKYKFILEKADGD